MKPNARPAPRVLWLLSLGVAGMVACAEPEGYGVFVETAPPPERVEVVEVAPAPDYVWVNGHWAWSGSAYTWEAGRWERPEPGHHHYHHGQWKHSKRGWYWVDGHWR